MALSGTCIQGHPRSVRHDSACCDDTVFCASCSTARSWLSKLLIDILAITYRFLEVFIAEVHRLRTAAIIRGYSPKWLPQAKIAGQMIGTLFIRSYERAERVYCAMKMRGYQGIYPSSPLSSWKGIEAFALCLVVIFFLAFRIVSR